jgi:hypothetical protein
MRPVAEDSAPPIPQYANVVQISTGPYDAIFDFGYRSPEQLARAPGDYVVIARIAMSLAHAKSMLPLLAKMIADYESRVGTIAVPGFDELGKA